MSINRTSFTLSAFAFIIFCSCQKELSGLPDEITSDSVTVIKSVRSVNYDDQNQLRFAKQENYLYDSFRRKTTVSIVDSSPYYNERRFSETFTYDNNGRLTLFESTTTDRISCNKMEFTYRPNGDIEKVLLHYNSGNIIENLFTYT